jgi:hypothetical protein
MSSLGALLDFLLRLAFFLVAPFVLALVTMRFPIAGALVNLGIALGVFFFAEAIRSRASRSRIIRALLGKQLRFEEYYRAHPPRTFLYYVFYPLLFPYWLINREARREFVLFKGYTLLSLAILIGGSVFQYLTKWNPELKFADFAGTLFRTLAVETIVVLAILMPFSTTVIAYHLSAKKLRLAVLVVASLVSVGLSIVYFAKKRHDVIPWPTGVRMHLRGRADPRRARASREDALRRAWALVHKGEGDFERDDAREVEISGPPLDVARTALGRFYKEDETLCFHLLQIDSKKTGRVIVLYGDPAPAKHPLVWVAMHEGVIFEDPAKLPSGAFARMKLATQR